MYIFYKRASPEVVGAMSSVVFVVVLMYDNTARGGDMSERTAICHSVSMCRIFHQQWQSASFTSIRWPFFSAWCRAAGTFWPFCSYSWWCARDVCRRHKWCHYKDRATQQKYDMLLPFVQLSNILIVVLGCFLILAGFCCVTLCHVSFCLWKVVALCQNG